MLIPPQRPFLAQYQQDLLWPPSHPLRSPLAPREVRRTVIRGYIQPPTQVADHLRRELPPSVAPD